MRSASAKFLRFLGGNAGSNAGFDGCRVGLPLRYRGSLEVSHRIAL
jgi:hypothetical protein